MKNMTDKTKKRLVITGGLVISVVLVILIVGAFKVPADGDVSIPDSSSEAPSLVVETPKTTENSNGDDTGTDQTIQPDITKKLTYTEENPIPPQTQNKPTEKLSNPGGLPGFDNVSNAGENENIYVGGMKENGNKVGIMD